MSHNPVLVSITPCHILLQLRLAYFWSSMYFEVHNSSTLCHDNIQGLRVNLQRTQETLSQIKYTILLGLGIFSYSGASTLFHKKKNFTQYNTVNLHIYCMSSFKGNKIICTLWDLYTVNYSGELWHLYTVNYRNSKNKNKTFVHHNS